MLSIALNRARRCAPGLQSACSWLPDSSAAGCWLAGFGGGDKKDNMRGLTDLLITFHVMKSVSGRRPALLGLLLVLSMPAPLLILPINPPFPADSPPFPSNP